MYVIKNKYGWFWGDRMYKKWTKRIENAETWGSQKAALSECDKANGERVFEVKLVLGKQVK